MGALALWRHVLADEQPGSAGPVLDALSAHGVATHEARADATAGPGIVLFDRVDARLLEFVREASRGGLERVVAIGVGDEPTPAATWSLLAAGAADVLVWRLHGRAPQEIAARFERWSAVDALVASPLVQRNAGGRSPAWIVALRNIVEVARFSDATVLILGETGTGKELAARLIHTLDPRPRKKDLVVLDCATVVPQLAGSEFFGHERGAFTDAVAARDGSFALADGGTLFLDEIGELPMSLQAELLRAIQERTFKRVGGNSWRTSSFRLVCASNRVLHADIAQNAFRSDLYYRIASVVIQLPPLRERSADILPLVSRFLSELHPHDDPPELDPPVREYLMMREYPGNVRDLRQLVHRIAARHVGPGPITVGDIPPDERPCPSGQPADWRDGAFAEAIRRAVFSGVNLRDIGRAATDIAVDVAVDEEGSIQRAARQLGVTDRALQLRRAARRGRNATAPLDATPKWPAGTPLAPS